MISEHYPDSSEVDQWCERLLASADATKYKAEELGGNGCRPSYGVRHLSGNSYLKFTGERFDDFYAYWQPWPGPGKAPLLIHVPGYGAEISAHPSLVSKGFNVLHVSPLGYATPDGFDESKKVNGNWPVLPETVNSCGERGYVNWLRDALIATDWATGQENVYANRIGFLGTSQGGGGALLLGSLMSGRSACSVAADVPFLTNFSVIETLVDRGAYGMAFEALSEIEENYPSRLPAACHSIGLIDTMSHAHRMTMPVMLTAGSEDTATPAVSIQHLFEKLPGTRSYTVLSNQWHAYTTPFIFMAGSWFQYYV
jgi:cephalosporin-C deacetylase-like acetyl esterase